MANSVKTIPADGTWTELTAGAPPSGLLQFQVRHGQAIFVQPAAAAPAATDTGLAYNPMQGESYPIGVLGTLRLWARVQVVHAEAGPARVRVIQE